MDDSILQHGKTQSTQSYLLTSVAKTHLGEVAAIIVSTLISYGRSTVKELSQRTKLSVKVVKTALVSLTQLNCVLYWKDEESKKVVYSFNDEGLKVFLHSGEIINFIKTKYGEDSAEIVQNILHNGNIKIADYFDDIDDKEVKLEKQTLFFKLFADKWLVRLQPINFNSVDDIWNKVYHEVLRNTPRNSTTSEVKRVAEATANAKVKFTELMEAGQSPKDLYDTKDGIKRLQPELVIKFNFPRFQKHLRTVALVNLAKSRIGTLTGKIYEAALELVESGSPDLSHHFLRISGLINDPEEERLFINSIENKLVDEKKIVFNVKDLLRVLPDDIDLTNSILMHNFVKPSMKRPMNGGEPPTKKVKTEIDDSAIAEFKNANGIQDMEELDKNSNDSDSHSLSLLQHHLKLLSSGSNVQFLIEVTPGTYTVPFTTLTKLLKNHYFETIVKSTLGQNAFRILRCLKAQKVGDEKSIANEVLLKEKTVRNEIYKLIKLNFAEIQEVPRSADRAASKTFYLFRHKERTSYDFLRNSLTFSMAEILTNIQDFKEEHKILLSKCEREDVKDHEEELLLDSELKTLKNLQSREIDNIGRFNRLKGIYDVFSL
jgi:DNA-directed RNA polymerase III subunit RPC3